MSTNNVKKNNFCINCSKYGHLMKKCEEPKTSNGIICISFCNLDINEDKLNKYISKQYIDIDSYNFSNINNISKLNMFKDNIKFLMVQRRYSMTYIDFIRGKYVVGDLDKLKNMFELMTNSEIKNIKTKNFDHLWNSLWKKTSKLKTFKKEYEKSKNKLFKLKELGTLDILVSIKSTYNTCEWGFPKGRCDFYENKYDCALREFSEETTLDINDLLVFNNLEIIDEEFIGTNGVNYKHDYYISSYKGSEDINCDCDDNIEIQDVKMFTWEEAVDIIRPYQTEKIKIINKIYFLFLNLYMDFIKQQETLYRQTF